VPRVIRHFYVSILATGFFWFTPEVYAGDIKVVRYSKEQIKEQLGQSFIKPASIGGVFISKLKEIASTATARQSGKNTVLRDLVLGAAEPTKQSWMKQMASLSYEQNQSSNGIDQTSLNKAVYLQTRKATEITLKNSFPIFERIKNGLTFNLSLGNSTSKKPSNDVRYGLIEKDILPSKNPIQLASFGSINDLDRAYSTPASVVYTIDRIDSNTGRQVFESSTESETEATKNFSWHRITGSKLTVKFDAANNEESFGDQVSGGDLPGLRMKISQFDGLVSMQGIFGKKSLEKTLRTEINLPIYGDIMIGQKLNEHFATSETVARNIPGGLLNSHVNIGYSRDDNKLRGEWQLNADTTNYSLIGESSKIISGNQKNTGDQTPDRIALGIQKNF